MYGDLASSLVSFSLPARMARLSMSHSAVFCCASFLSLDLRHRSLVCRHKGLVCRHRGLVSAAGTEVWLVLQAQRFTTALASGLSPATPRYRYSDISSVRYIDTPIQRASDISNTPYISSVLISLYACVLLPLILLYMCAHPTRDF